MPAEKLAFGGHLVGQGATHPGFRSGLLKNDLNSLILINFICRELFVDFQIKKIMSASSHKPIIISILDRSLTRFSIWEKIF